MTQDCSLEVEPLPLTDDDSPRSDDRHADPDPDDTAAHLFSSPFALLVMSLPDQRVRSANRAAVAIIGLTREELIHRRAAELVVPSEAAHTSSALDAVATGSLDSYRAHCTLVGARGPIEVWMWVRAVPCVSGALAVLVVLPVCPTETSQLSVLNLNGPLAALASGTMDAAGQVTTLSCSDTGILDDHDDCSAGSFHLASQVHADDQPRLWQAIKRFRTNRDDVMLVIRVRHSQRGWLQSLCHLFLTGDAEGEPLGFMLVEGTIRNTATARIVQLEQSLDRISAEADSARSDQPSSVAVGVATIDLSSLTNRQRDIVTRLLQGSRVTTIAQELFVSSSTIRNHLSTVYRAYHVHSQAELLERLKLG